MILSWMYAFDRNTPDKWAILSLKARIYPEKGERVAHLWLEHDEKLNASFFQNAHLPEIRHMS